MAYPSESRRAAGRPRTDGGPAVQRSRWARGLARRLARRPSASPVVGVVLSGGGASASFHVGALRYLYDVQQITPTVITGTSAGSILAALLAQSDDREGQRQALEDIESAYDSLRSPADLMVELSWFAELQKLAPALQRVSQPRPHPVPPQTVTLPMLGLRRQRRAAGSGPAPGPGDPTGARPAAGQVRLPRWDPTPVRETLSALWSVGRARPDFDELLRGGRSEQSMFRRGPIFDRLLGPDRFDPDRVARSAVQLRIAVVGLESGELRYVTGQGAMVDRADQPILPAGAVDLVDAVHASCALPAIYPPVQLGAEHYVDGGIRENLPVDVAMSHLGVTRCYAISSLAQGLATESSYAGKDMLAVVLRATAGIMADEVQLDGVARAQAAGAILISPEVSILGLLDVDPGLLRIAADYGYLRAAEACEGASAEEQQTGRELMALRRQIWQVENELLDPAGSADAGAPAELAGLKARLRDLVARVPARRLPAAAPRWWQEWERHATAVAEPVSWLDPPPTPAAGPAR